VKRRNLDDSGGRGAGVSAVFAKDTLRCWLRSWKRFVSIAVITLLGVAVLTGIYAGCRDAFLAAGRFYDQQGLHDLQVLSTYGLTDDDAAALRRNDRGPNRAARTFSDGDHVGGRHQENRDHAGNRYRRA